MLAKIVNDNACCLIRRVVLGFFASKLAPTVVFAVPINPAHTKNARHNRAFCVLRAWRRGAHRPAGRVNL
ncbi:hypothetical protein DK871_04170 [Pseudomonas sp. L13]|nr:hypothetical protein [Pseudomonas sp. L13]